ncbi:unnamed protein product [Allacma fusca]|uniref:Venom dipeptidyl peptidase 4 n=1 Tax=Allacma fusca TaxID=39272 RepID=A0A8J2JVJ2_9HEXA|nr:unnamed protein product [Allacma fusca]
MDDNFYDEEDLVTSNPNDRNWKGIIIAVVVIATVLALIVTSVVLLTPPDEGPRVKGRRFQLEDIFSPNFQPLSMNGSWVSDNEWLFWDTSGGVSILTMDKDSTSLRSFISNYTFRQFDAKLSGISADLQYALLVHDVQPVHRHSSTAKYTLYHTETRAIQELSVGKRFSGYSDVDPLRLELVEWSPSGCSLVFVHQGDIYFKSEPTSNVTHRLTRSAIPGVISNGVPDWLYEEEILESNSALWFSKDGDQLLYLMFNDSLVGQQTMLHYGSVEEPFIYPQIKQLRYPKPGTTNPTVTARVVELSQSRAFRTQDLRPPEGILNMDYYITAGGWVRKNEVGIIWTSRSYDLSIITVCSTRNGSCEEMYRITMEDKRGWVDRIPFPVFTSNSTSWNFITIAPIRDGENGYFDHLVFVDTVNKRSHPVTHGKIDVLMINAWDEERKLIYFLAIPATAPTERRFYRLRVEQPFTDHIPECLSCPTVPRNDTLPETRVAQTNFTVAPTTAPMLNKQGSGKKTQKGGKTIGGTKHFAPEPGSVIPEGNAYLDLIDPLRSTDNVSKPTVLEDPVGNLLFGVNQSCSFVTRVKFNANKSFATIECGGPSVPFVTLASVTQSNMRLIQTIQSNDALRNLSGGMAFPRVKTFDVQLNAGHTVQVRLLLPPGLREDEITRYPLVLNVYGGPGTQLVLDRWNVDFATYLASRKDFIVAQVDSRGSGGRGWDFQHKVYYKVGLFEAEDQIQVVRYLRDSLHFVDEKKIGVWGWSYGGYLTAMIMGNKDSSNLFQCGASVAPVTNWKLYDSAYTERYMGGPNVTQNYRGYTESDITQSVENFDKKMFFLLHGTADDNVHVQHSMMLSKALIAKKILFRQQIYPDEAHSLKGVQLHVHKSLEEFFEDCFRKQRDPGLITGLNQGGQLKEFED